MGIDLEYIIIGKHFIMIRQHWLFCTLRIGFVNTLIACLACKPEGIAPPLEHYVDQRQLDMCKGNGNVLMNLR